MNAYEKNLLLLKTDNMSEQIQTCKVTRLSDGKVTVIDQWKDSEEMLAEALGVDVEVVHKEWLYSVKERRAEYTVAFYRRDELVSRFYFLRKPELLLARLHKAEAVLRDVQNTGFKLCNDTIIEPIMEYFGENLDEEDGYYDS